MGGTELILYGVFDICIKQFDVIADLVLLTWDYGERTRTKRCSMCWSVALRHRSRARVGAPLPVAHWAPPRFFPQRARFNWRLDTAIC